jgi:hypothetical protein
MKSKKIATYSEFIKFIAELAAIETNRSLSEYLLALWSLIQNHRNEKPSFSLFRQLLFETFEKAPAPFDEAWLAFARLPSQDDDIETFESLQQTILCQLADLQRMKSVDISPAEKYGGFTLTNGNTWYNFDISTFLECASAGLFDSKKSDSNTTECTWSDLAEVLIMGQIYE